MEPLQYSRFEMRKAESVIEKMKIAKGFEEFEISWIEFLNNIEKLWVKAERECQHIKNRFQPWQGYYKNLRRIDPLLVYIKQARDADNHSIQELIAKIPESQEFIPDDLTKPPVFDIPHITLYRADDNGQWIEYPNPNPGIYRVTPSHVLSKAIMNNGKAYAAPRFHRGQTIKNETSPTVLATLALQFYKAFLAELEEKFFLDENKMSI